MGLMGQAVFSLELVRKYHRCKSVRSVALCKENDSVLGPLLQSFPSVKVISPPFD